MDEQALGPSQYLQAVGRRWPIPVVIALLAGALAWTFAPASSASGATEGTSSYRATVILLTVGDPESPGFSNPDSLTQLMLIRPIRNRVADILNYTGDPEDLARGIEVKTAGSSGFVYLNVRRPDADEASDLSNAWAKAVIDFLSDRQSTLSGARAKAYETQIRDLRERLDQLEAETPVDDTEAAITRAKIDAITQRLGFTEAAYAEVLENVSTGAGVQVVQKGRATLEGTTEGVFDAANDPKLMSLLAGLLGLLLGAGIAIVLDHRDDRIRSKPDAEKHFMLPVIAQIPPITRSMVRNGTLAVVGSPWSQVADSFRALATSLLHRPNLIEGKVDPSGASSNNGHQQKQVILVTSPAPGDGKSTIVANLAATFAELGKRVMVLSCDFRRPSLHKIFGISNEAGLSEALHNSNGSPILSGSLQENEVGRYKIQVVPSGPIVEQPGELLSSEQMRRAIREARLLADIVLIDTAPLLTASEAALLFPLVDAVVLVARAGRTTVGQANETSDFLLRLGAPVAGVALNRMPTEAVSYRGYGEYRPVEPESRKTRRGKTPLARHSADQ